MSKILLSVHVLAAILAVGPVAVAAGMFPAAVRRDDVKAATLLHRAPPADVLGRLAMLTGMFTCCGRR